MAFSRSENMEVLSTLTVANLNDSANFTAGDGSLRGEIAAAQSGDTIQFAADLAGQTINLTAGELLINKNLSILGPTTAAGAPNITINNGGLSRIFDIEGGGNGVSVTLQNLTVQGGTANEGGGLFINDTAGTVTLNNLDITSNSAVGAAGQKGANAAKGVLAQSGTPGQDALGGGVFFAGGNAATLVISNSILQSNRVNGGSGGRGGYGGRDFNGTGSGNGIGGAGGAGGFAEGGALYVNGGSVQLTNDTLKNNALRGGQGGIGSDGGVTAGNHNAVGGAGGGLAAAAGLYVSSGLVQLSGDTIEGNTSHGGRGGVGGSGGNVEPSGPAATGASGQGGNAEGGGLFVNAGGVQLSTNTLQNNAATGGSNPMSNAGVHSGGSGFGGGLFVQGGTLLVGNSTLASNVANGGGATSAPCGAYGGAAVLANGNAQFFNDTIALNITTPGAGFANASLGSSLGGALVILAGDLRLTNDTLANNLAAGGVNSNNQPGTNGFGGALANTNGTVEMANTILAFNNAQNSFGTSSEIFGTINSSYHDLIDNASDIFGTFTPGAGDQLGVSPNIAPLGNYGGPTQTMPLLSGSPAIDAGDNSFQGPATIASLADWWRGEGNAADSAGTNNGTVVGGVSYTPGLVGQAFNFNGQGSYVDLGTGADITGTAAFTIGVWIRTTSDGVIINQRDPANFNGEYVLAVTGGKLSWATFGNNQYGFNFTSNQSVNDGNWHFVAVTRLADGTGQIYIDGKLDHFQTVAPVPLGSGFHVYLGEDVRNAVDIGPSASANFVGQIDEVQLYNQALTAGQIQSLAVPSYTAFGFGPAGAWPATLPGLVSWLPGEGNFADAAGSNPGTAQGGVSFTQGLVGQAFQLDGSTGKITLADNPSLDPASFTVGGWFQLTQAPAAGSVSYLASKYDGSLRGWSLGVNSSLVPTFSIFSVGSGASKNGVVNNGDANATAATPLALNQWYYLSATFDSTTGTATLYVNGTAAATATLSSIGYSPSFTPLVIGSASWTNGGYFAGKVDEFSFYNRALTPGEISLLSTPVATDQRGGARIVGTHVDIGATEYQYDVAITGSAPATVIPGSPLSIAFTVTNKGLDPVANVALQDTLPDGVTFTQAGSPSGWISGQVTGNSISFFSAAGLAPGASATFTVTGTVSSKLAAGTVLTNTVAESPIADDTAPGNNSLILTTTVAAPVTITQPNDPGFELPQVGASYLMDPTGSPWTFAGVSGVAGNGGPVTSGNPNAPQGTQVAWMQNGGTISQAVNFAAGTYFISLEAAQRGNFPSNSTIQVMIDGQTVGALTPTSTSNSLYTTNSFTVAAGSHTIQFVGVGAGGSTALFDQVTILSTSAASPPAPRPAPSPVTQPNDPGFETPNVGNGYQMDPAGSPWTFAGAAGVAGNGGPVTSGNPNAPQGTQVAWMQNGGTISQAVNFAAGAYTISFDAAQRGNFPSNSSIRVLVDGQTVDAITPKSTSYALYTTASFTVTAGSHTIQFVGVGAGGSTALLDQVSIQTVPTGVDIHGQPHDAVVGQSIGPVVVAVVDANGNTVPDSDQLVTLSIDSGPNGAVLGGQTTVQAVNGVATFTDLTLNVAGTYTLKATGGKLDPDFSNLFTISFADVSDDVKVHSDPLHQVHGQSGVFEQKVTITNTGRTTLDGPLALVLTDLPTGVTLQGASGSYQGNPYVDILNAKDALAPGQKVTVTLTFLVTGLKNITDLSYSTETLQGI
jgi:uncharacterized repeat protein (TIGR01451 family)